MKEKMPWLKTRLREIGKTPAALARTLGIASPRVYEMIAGRRHIQPEEIAPMAAFLEWTMEDLKKKLPPSAQKMLTLRSSTQKYLQDVASIGPLENGNNHFLKLLHQLVDHAPKPVEAQELRDAIVKMIVERYKDRHIQWQTLEMALALVCYEVKCSSMRSPEGDIGKSLRIA